MNVAEKNISSIIIFRALQLGDLLCSVAAFRALRKGLPQAHITIAGLPWMKQFARRFSDYIDEFIWFPGYPGLPEQPFDAKATLDFLAQIQKRKFDLALQMQGNGSIVNPMIEMFGAKYNAGFYRKADYYPGDGFVEYPEGIHESRRHLLLMKHIGLEHDDETPEFPVTDADVQELKNAIPELNGKPYICVHPGSRGSWRQWPPEYFASLADLVAQKGYQIVLTGTAEEAAIVDQVAVQIKSHYISAVGKTSLGAMAALIKSASGLISNCTGVSHIAAACKTKSVVISMDGEPERWGPLDTHCHRTINWLATPQFNLAVNAANDLFKYIP